MNTETKKEINPLCTIPRVVGSFYRVNIIGTGWLLAEFNYHKWDFLKKEPCLIIDGYKVNEDEFNEIEVAF